jgi:hypothetical protein
MANLKADLKIRLLNEESCNVTSAIRECCKAPAIVHLAMSNKNDWEQGPSVALGFTSLVRKREDPTQEKEEVRTPLKRYFIATKSL